MYIIIINSSCLYNEIIWYIKYVDIIVNFFCTQYLKTQCEDIPIMRNRKKLFLEIKLIWFDTCVKLDVAASKATKPKKLPKLYD